MDPYCILKRKSGSEGAEVLQGRLSGEGLTSIPLSLLPFLHGGKPEDGTDRRQRDPQPLFPTGGEAAESWVTASAYF